MPSARQLLDQAPPEEIASLHSERLGREGLLQRSRIRTEVESWITSPDRLNELLTDRPRAREIARAIHLAGDEGIPCAEFSDADQDDLALLSTEFVIVADRSDSPSWHPLTDLTATVLADTSVPGRERPHGQRTTARAFLEGLASLTAGIDLGTARLNRDGSLNRRDRPALRACFSHMSTFGEAAEDLALDLALRLLSSLGLLRHRDGRLETSAELDTWLESADNDPAIAIRWWEALDPRTEELHRWVSGHAPQGLSGEEARIVFQHRSGIASADRTPGLWGTLPVALRQALAVGLLDAEVADGQIVHVWPWHDAPPPRAERIWWCTPDFQLFLSPGSPLARHRDAAFIARRESSDLVTRLRIERDTFLAGASADTWASRLPGLLEDLAPARAVAFQLEEWLASRRACLFESVRILRVADARRHQELAALDNFCLLVRETIPGWGFVIDAQQEPQIRRLLASLGYDPPGDPSPTLAVPWSTGEPATTRAEDSTSWLWPGGAGPARRTIPGSTSRYAGAGLKELDFSSCLRLAEYAALTEHEIEVVLKAQPARSIRLRPLRVDRRREPATLEAILVSSGERRDVPIESIRKIGLLED